ncbi:MAG: hypothetical protein IPN59_13830 [Holophaga sp.]|nr:hypothetical protein [Holophaga sp.]
MVALNDATRQDFTFYAGKLTYAPAGVTASLAWGASASRAITVTNIGQGPATFEISATLGGFNPLWPEGRPPFKRKVKAWPAENHLYQLAPTGGQKNLSPIQPYLWTTTLAIPTGPVVRAAAASCDGKTFYLFGGENTFGVTKTTQRYNPAANAWTTLEPMPVALTNIQAVCIGNYIYLTGGYNGSLQTNEFQIYDTQKNLWAHSSWPNVRTPMAATYNRKLYAFGGSPGPSAETWMYNPQTNVWQNLAAPMPVAAEFGAAVTVGDYIYIIGGVSGSELKKVQRYDPNNNTWSLGPDLPDARSA